MTDDFQGGLRGDPVARNTPTAGTRDLESSSPDPIPLPRHPSALSDDLLLQFWRSVQGPRAGLTGPLIRYAGLVADAIRAQHADALGRMQMSFSAEEQRADTAEAELATIQRPAIEALIGVGRRISGTASLLQRTQNSWTADEQQQFNRLCEWSKEIFDRTSELEKLVPRHPSERPKEKINGDTDTDRHIALHSLGPALDCARPQTLGPRWTSVDQTKFGNDEGNCLAACLASYFNCSIDEVPDFGALHVIGADWWQSMRKFGMARGVSIVHVGKGWLTSPPRGLHIQGGTSPRPEITHGHVVLIQDGVMVHDPHPSRAGLAEVEDYYLMIEMTSGPRHPSERQTPAIVAGYDATFWHESYTMLRDAITTHLDDCIRDDDVAEECILVEAIETAGQRLAAADPILRARPQQQETEGDTDPRVDHTQYPSNPLATAASHETTPSAERLLWLAAKVQAQNQFLFEGAAQMYDGSNRPKHDMLTCAEESHAGCHLRAFVEGVRMLISAGGDGNQPPGGIREDPVATRTVTAPHAHDSSADFSSTRARRPREDAWQPIESAPKDGTQFLGFVPSYYRGQGGHALVLWLDGEWYDAKAWTVTPTHWMPLPATPSSGGTDE